MPRRICLQIIGVEHQVQRGDRRFTQHSAQQLHQREATQTRHGWRLGQPIALRKTQCSVGRRKSKQYTGAFVRRRRRSTPARRPEDIKRIASRVHAQGSQGSAQGFKIETLLGGKCVNVVFHSRKWRQARRCEIDNIGTLDGCGEQ
jgi:hypothetical protein